MSPSIVVPVSSHLACQVHIPSGPPGPSCVKRRCMTSSKLPPNAAPQPTELPCNHGPPLPVHDAPAATRRAVYYACSLVQGLMSTGTHAYHSLSRSAQWDAAHYEQGGKDVMPPVVPTGMERSYLFSAHPCLSRPLLKLGVWR
jgi:hypothetical protein